MKWAQIILWLQMWAPLYAILNYIMAARGKTLALLSASNEAGVTIASSVTNINVDIQAMAGYVHPVSRHRARRWVFRAHGRANISQSAAGASEVATGNLSYGNVSEGNMQIANMLQHNRTGGYRAGGFQLQDGRVDITTSARRSSISARPVSINAAESLSSQQMATTSHQKGMNLSESSSQHLSSASRSAVQLSESLGRMESSGDNASLGISTEQSQAIHRGANLVEDFSKQNNVSTDKAANILGEASVGLGKNSVSFSGKGSLNAQDQELYQKAQKYACGSPPIKTPCVRHHKRHSTFRIP